MKKLFVKNVLLIGIACSCFASGGSERAQARVNACENNAVKHCSDYTYVNEGLSLNSSCRTTQGKCVTRIKRGDLEGIEINGKFFSNSLRGDYTNHIDSSDAENACKKIGMRLPTKSELIALKGSFALWWEDYGIEKTDFTSNGLDEFRAVMGADFAIWSSSDYKVPNQWPMGDAWVMNGYGDFFPDTRDLALSVRCVLPRDL